MNRTTKLTLLAVPTAVVALALLSGGCVSTSHAVQASRLGTASSSQKLLEVIDQPGPLQVETVISADWAVDRSGLINLDAPKAKQAGLVDGDEPIEVYFHVIRHPQYGMFIIDTGLEVAMRDDREHAAVQGLVASVMHFEKTTFHHPLGEWLREHPEKLQGVLLTHAHLDHVSGLPDVPKGTPIYTGPGEAGARLFTNVLVKPNLDRAFEGQAPISEWGFTPDPQGRFAGVLDVFGDGSLWALWVPGHTPGSTAFLARTANGPVLFTGDTSHTTWGWRNAVEPGSFTADHQQNLQSLQRLLALVAEHPAIDVRLGHQEGVRPSTAAAAATVPLPAARGD